MRVELWWTLESLWTARSSNQSILKEISPEYSLEGLMLKLKFQSFDHLMQRTDSLEKTLMLGKIGGRRRGRQRMRWLDGIADPTCQWTCVRANSGRWWRTGKPGVLQSTGSQRVGHEWATEQQQIEQGQRLVEFTDGEPWIRRADCKIMLRFSTSERGHL